MPAVNLLGQPYAGKSIIASTQGCINLYPEDNQPPNQFNVFAGGNAPAPITYYQFPGCELYSAPLNAGINRCMYRTSIGTVYTVVGPTVYLLQSNGAMVFVGSIPDRASQVYMSDNGLAVVIVDGSNLGYAIDMATNDFGQIIDPSFYGADVVKFCQTFFIFNRPGTNQFYISLSMVNFAMLTGTAIGGGSIANDGNGYVLGVYQSVSLTGGSGTGATADITIANAYVETGTITTQGASYVNGTYNNVPLTGGSGTGETATIIVSGNKVTSVVPLGTGKNYVVGDILSASNSNLGGAGIGFTYTVNTLLGVVTAVGIDTPGENYIDGDILSANASDIGGTGSGFTWTVSSINNAFDPLDIAAKAGNADPISTILVIQNNLWLIGELTTEPWIGTGAADFFFQQVQGTFINHGCIAKYSAATTDVIGFWLMQDLQGKNIIMKTTGYNVTEVSTPYLVSQFNTYETTDDAIGMILQKEDHAFYILVFPTANVTWMMELTTGYWSKLGKWNTNTGNFDRYRANGCCYAFGFNLIGDYATGKVYKLNAQLATDDGDNMKFIRTCCHMVGPEYQRVIYKNASANIEPGTSLIPVGSVDDGDNPQIFLSWSDDRGKTFGTPIPQSMGRQGEFLTDPQWNRLGYARDRVFKLEWDGPVITALNGMFAEVAALRT